jgi:hypothetical protein
LDYICHFHFLKDIGKDLFGDDYRTIHRHLKTLRIRSDLRNIAKGLKKAIDSNPDSLQCLHRYLESKRLLEPQTLLTPQVKAYLIICWILEARNESNGFGFPFDRPHFDFSDSNGFCGFLLNQWVTFMLDGGYGLPIGPSKALSD